MFKDIIYNQSRKSKYQFATLFLVFAFFFHFIDFGKVNAQCGGNCNSTAWTYSTDAEKINVSIDGGCDVLISYRYRECLISIPPPPTIKRDIQITTMEMSSACSGVSEEDIMKEANKRLLWNVRSIFGITSSSFDVTLITPNCWRKQSFSDTIRFNPCDSTYCCKTNYTIQATDYNYEVTNSSTIPANDSTCAAGVGGGCGEYICNSQFIPLDTPLWDASEFGCDDECSSEWSNRDNLYVQVVIGSCTFNVHFINRLCDGVMEIGITKIVQIGSCGSTIQTTDILSDAFQLIAQYIKNTYNPIPNLRFLVKSCWLNSTFLIRYPCTYENCCIGNYVYNSGSNRYNFLSQSNSSCSSLPDECTNVCNALFPERFILSKISEIDNINLNESISIYPNPIDDYLIINYLVKENQNINVEIVDLLGNQLISQNFSINTGNNVLKINTLKFRKNNLFFLNIYNSNKELIYNGKITK